MDEFSALELAPIRSNLNKIVSLLIQKEVNMHRKILPFALLGLLILVGPCRNLWDWLFYTPVNTPCIPISYPNGTRLDVESNEVYTFETNSPYIDVVDFYRSNLQFDPPLKTDYDDTVEWNEYPIRDVGILFECNARLTSYEGETGCIFVHDEDGKGVVNVTWSYSEGAVAPCYKLPEIEPEDYLPTP